jgi:hypothetical protein
MKGQALLITKTKAAEAEGNAIKISAEAEKEAARLRGQGVALFRQEVARGMTEAAEQMKQANLDTNVILFSMWTEAIKNFAEFGKGNVIFLDGSAEGMEATMKQIQALMVKQGGDCGEVVRCLMFEVILQEKFDELYQTNTLLGNKVMSFIKYLQNSGLKGQSRRARDASNPQTSNLEH